MVIFYKKWKKYDEIQLTKNKMDLNIRKMTNHPPFPVTAFTLNSWLLKPLNLATALCFSHLTSIVWRATASYLSHLTSQQLCALAT